MAEIFRKLKALDFQWKIVTPYFIRCRYVDTSSSFFLSLEKRVVLGVVELYDLSYTVEPPILETPNKGHNRKKPP